MKKEKFRQMYFVGSRSSPFGLYKFSEAWAEHRVYYDINNHTAPCTPTISSIQRMVKIQPFAIVMSLKSVTGHPSSGVYWVLVLYRQAQSLNRTHPKYYLVLVVQYNRACLNLTCLTHLSQRFESRLVFNKHSREHSERC